VLENFGTQGAGETLQAGDLRLGGYRHRDRHVGRDARVHARRADPVIAAAYAGTGDQYWYVKPDSPLKTPRGRDRQAHHVVFDQWRDLACDRARVRQAARRQGEADRDRRTARDLHDDDVRTGRHRLGRDAVRLKEYQEGKFRIIARGSDVPTMRNQTMRVQVVTPTRCATART
jgi:NitT/TauT family transport system substrate-binding protein